MEYCPYVNVFQGNGEIDLPKAEGIAATWILIKGQTGNTHPFAARPFGKLTCGGYSGGYPTGLGNHCVNTCGSVRKLWQGKKLRGFAHLHHTGTGGVGYYFNYALTAGFTGALSEAFALSDMEAQEGEPGYYAAGYRGIRHAATVSEKAALHEIVFPQAGGKVAVDFANDGLTPEYGKFWPENLRVWAVSPTTAVCEGIFQGVRLWMAMECAESTDVRLWKDGAYCEAVEEAAPQAPMGAVFEIAGQAAHLRFSVSPRSLEKALADLQAAPDFDTACREAHEAWERALSVIEIDAVERTKRIFYSNLYHSLIKPSDWTGESFLYDDPEGKLPFTLDYMTFWDIYKTELPLLFWLFPDMAEKISESLTLSARAMGKFPNALDLSVHSGRHDMQARLLGAVTLATGYWFGVKNHDYEGVLDLILQDIRRQTDFLETGRCERYTHILDTAQACEAAAMLAADLGRTGDAAWLWEQAGKMDGAYGPDGLLSEDSPYYEGGRWNYSFRITADMERRMALSGGREAFVRQLDHFFGFGEPAQPIPETPEDFPFTQKLVQVGRFEGYNNEPDMETPYAYLFAGRHDRTCEVVRAGMKYMFCEGEGGLPGNNDTGGLSSCYVWNTLGLFPAAGLDFVMLGSPGLDAADVRMASGQTLRIRTLNRTPDSVRVRRALWDGTPVPDWRIPTRMLMQGGTLTFEME